MLYLQDYGIDFDDHDHPVKAFKCRCGSKFCRNIKRSSSKCLHVVAIEFLLTFFYSNLGLFV